MKKKKEKEKSQVKNAPENEIDEIRQLIKKQELQTAILKKLIEKSDK